MPGSSNTRELTLNPIISGSLINGSNPGVFLLSYICDPGISLDDNEVLFTLEFNYVGPPGGAYSTISFPSNPPEANEYSSPEGIPYDKDPFESYFIDGSVTVDIYACGPLEGPLTFAPVMTACSASNIAVPVSVANFNDVGGISLTLNYDANNPAIPGNGT